MCRIDARIYNVDSTSDSVTNTYPHKYKDMDVVLGNRDFRPTDSHWSREILFQTKIYSLE